MPALIQELPSLVNSLRKDGGDSCYRPERNGGRLASSLPRYAMALRIPLFFIFCFLSVSLFGAGDKSKPKKQTCAPVWASAYDGKLSAPFARAVQALIDAGPEKWIQVEGTDLGGLIFQRGISGELGLSGKPKKKHLSSGAQDALAILLGDGNAKDAHTSVLPELAESDNYLERVNRAYSFPLVVRGSAERIGLKEPTLPETSSPATIPAGQLAPANIHSMGFFFPDVSQEHNYVWASNYFTLMQSLKDKGISPTAGSRGEKFFTDLKEVWDARRWHYPYQEGFWLNELANKPQTLSNIRSVFSKYRK